MPLTSTSLKIARELAKGLPKQPTLPPEVSLLLSKMIKTTLEEKKLAELLKTHGFHPISSENKNNFKEIEKEYEKIEKNYEKNAY